MTEIADRYRRLADAFTAKVADVPAGRWGDATPCEEWSARDLVGHMRDTHGMFLGFVGGSLPELPSVDEDPLGMWTGARDAVQAELDDPERAGAEFDGFFGRSTFEGAVDRFLSFDLVVHGWDLAHATGQDERIDPADVARVRVAAEALGDAMRGPGVFGPAVDPPPDADDQAKLLAFLGRDPA